MKNIITAVSAAGLVALSGSAFAQTATSNVVGYETLTYAGGFNFIGVRLHEAPIASGDLESATASTATDSDTDLGALITAGSYVLELEDGSGIIQEITSATGTAVDTSSDLSGLTFPVDYTLRPAATIATVFGAANESGLTSAAGFGASDQVWLSNGAGFDKYYFAAGAFGAPGEWKTEAGASVDSTTVPIVYTDAVILNSQPAGGSLVVAGDLKAAATQVALGDGFNFVGSVAPVGATLESIFGAANEAGLTSAAAFGGSDQVWVPNGASFDKYFFAAGAFGAPGEWKSEAGASVTASSISIPSGYILNNTGGPQNADTSVPSYYAGL